MAKANASQKLLDLASALSKQAQEEGLTVIELEGILEDARKDIGLKSRIPSIESAYRKPTEKELEYKEKCLNFFIKELTPEHLSYAHTLPQGQTISKEKQDFYLHLFAEIMCAAKMLHNDDEKLTNIYLRDVLWSTGNYSNYTQLLSSISFATNLMREIAILKYDERSWECINVGLSCSRTSRIINGYFKILKTHKIE